MPKVTPVRWQRLEKVFLRLGYVFSNQEGSHRTYVRAGSPRPVVIPTYGDVPVFIIMRNLRTAGVSRDEYLRLLEEV
ncbi:MAG TPA: type II toxin-antitoxin system HicA family toxin [Tepidisphaeraceae bacterium]|nr:type II toxin-antitoxin system HicA family toxin [Tepidisphaeraceae bacterium]